MKTTLPVFMYLLVNIDNLHQWRTPDIQPSLPESVPPPMATNIGFSITIGRGVTMNITNYGTANARSVPWQIHVEGGRLGRIDKTVKGIIDIPAGGSKTVRTGRFFGLGSISITAKVANEEKTATGKQFIIFSIVN
jgi:hypothetical protein